MARNGKWRWIIGVSTIGLVVTLLTIFVSGGKALGKIQEEQLGQDKAIETVKMEGSLPARKNTYSIGIMENRLCTIDEKQEEFSVEQKEMRQENEIAFKEILNRLPK